MSLLVLIPLLAQIGPASSLPSNGNPYVSGLPLEIIEKKDDEARREARTNAHGSVDTSLTQPRAAPSGGCMDAVETDAERSAELARDALSRAIGRERVRAGMCLGIALSDLGRFDEARTAFVTARDATDTTDHLTKARLGAMAGNAALAQGEPGQALLLLGPAVADARTAAAKDLIASISLDRARALVAVKQPDEAEQALAEARAAEPENAQAWLLSATLARRQNKLTEAQARIVKAANLAPDDPEVGLEAGVIAMLSGNKDAARKSWTSVTQAAPGSDAAAQAKQYLEETASDTGPVGPPMPEKAHP